MPTNKHCPPTSYGTTSSSCSGCWVVRWPEGLAIFEHVPANAGALNPGDSVSFSIDAYHMGFPKVSLSANFNMMCNNYNLPVDTTYQRDFFVHSAMTTSYNMFDASKFLVGYGAAKKCKIDTITFMDSSDNNLPANCITYSFPTITLSDPTVCFPGFSVPPLVPADNPHRVMIKM